MKLIREKFGITYNPNYFCRWLRKHAFTPQKPAKRASQRDEARIKEWAAKDWATLLKKGASEHAHVVLIDETGLQLAPLRRRT